MTDIKFLKCSNIICKLRRFQFKILSRINCSIKSFIWVKVLVTWLCPTLCNPVDYRPRGKVNPPTRGQHLKNMNLNGFSS